VRLVVRQPRGQGAGPINGVENEQHDHFPFDSFAVDRIA
jgi:hypothetical protein